nr:ribonuclease P protein subunit p20 isoform X2 [Chlorocebus sabaeus]
MGKNPAPRTASPPGVSPTLPLRRPGTLPALGRQTLPLLAPPLLGPGPRPRPPASPGGVHVVDPVSPGSLALLKRLAQSHLPSGKGRGERKPGRRFVVRGVWARVRTPQPVQDRGAGRAPTSRQVGCAPILLSLGPGVAVTWAGRRTLQWPGEEQASRAWKALWSEES